MPRSLVVAQAWLPATVASRYSFFHQFTSPLCGGPLGLLLAGRSPAAPSLAWATERAAHRASASAKSELRRSAAENVADWVRPDWTARTAGA